MAFDKLVDSAKLDENLVAVANAIRLKTGSSNTLSFPDDFISQIESFTSNSSSSYGNYYTESIIFSGNSVQTNYLINHNLNDITSNLGFVIIAQTEDSLYLGTYAVAFFDKGNSSTGIWYKGENGREIITKETITNGYSDANSFTVNLGGEYPFYPNVKYSIIIWKI